MTAVMGRMATYSGRVITWDDAVKSTLRLAPDRYAMDAVPPTQSRRGRQLSVRHAGTVLRLEASSAAACGFAGHNAWHGALQGHYRRRHPCTQGRFG